MFKHLVAIIIVSILVVTTMRYTQQALHGLLAAHDWVTSVLSNVFTGGKAGSIVKNLIALLALPLFIGLIPAGFYWLIRKSWFPHFMAVVWVVWLIQVGALVIMQQGYDHTSSVVASNE